MAPHPPNTSGEDALRPHLRRKALNGNTQIIQSGSSLNTTAPKLFSFHPTRLNWREKGEPNPLLTVAAAGQAAFRLERGSRPALTSAWSRLASLRPDADVFRPALTCRFRKGNQSPAQAALL